MLAGRRCCRPGPDRSSAVACGPALTLAALLPLARTRPEQIMVRCLQDSMRNDPGVYVLGNAVREVRYAELCYVDLCNR